MNQGYAVRGGRARLRMTQSALAGAAGVSLNTIKRAEAGLPLQDENIRSICAVLGIDVAGFPRPVANDSRSPEVTAPGPVHDAVPGEGVRSLHQGPMGTGPDEPSEWARLVTRCQSWDPSPEIRFLIALGAIGSLFVPSTLQRALTHMSGLTPSMAPPPPELAWLDPKAVNMAFSGTMLYALMLLMTWSIIGMVVCGLTGKDHPLLSKEELSPKVPICCAACFFVLIPMEGSWGIFQNLGLTLTGVVLGTANLSWLVGVALVLGQIAVLLRLVRSCYPLLQGPPLLPLGLAMGFLTVAPANGLPLAQVIATFLVFACAVAWRRPSGLLPGR